MTVDIDALMTLYRSLLASPVSKYYIPKAGDAGNFFKFLVLGIRPEMWRSATQDHFYIINATEAVKYLTILCNTTQYRTIQDEVYWVLWTQF